VNKVLVSISVFCLLAGDAFSQISPPGLGKARTADWFALGIRQELDTIEGKGWQSMTYVGIGRKSNPDNYDPLFKSSILVLTQEFYKQFHRHFQYSGAVSYRRQHNYLDEAPYAHGNPSFKQEYRVYGRFSYILKTPRLKFVPTFRQEFRKFYSPGFKDVSEDFQLRSRLRLQLSVMLDRAKSHRLIFSSEQLTSISKQNSPEQWTPFDYRESRFSLYYSLSPQSSPFIFSVGYMNNLVGYRNPYDVSYIALDVVWENPFKLRQRAKDNIPENFE
jgi:hypothetical protein